MLTREREEVRILPLDFICVGPHFASEALNSALLKPCPDPCEYARNADDAAAQRKQLPMADYKIRDDLPHDCTPFSAAIPFPAKLFSAVFASLHWPRGRVKGLVVLPVSHGTDTLATQEDRNTS